MTTLAVTRKQRLRSLEKDIRSGMEEFYHMGMKLKEIRDDELYKEDGFESWQVYCRVRWEWSQQHASRLIIAAEYREKIPTSPSGCGEWGERSVRELTRIPNKRDAARVAAKVLKEVEATEGGKLTSTIVRRFVDEDLGIKRSKPKPAQKDKGIDLREYISGEIGVMEAVRESLEKIPAEIWERFIDDNPRMIKRLITSCESLTALLRKVLR